METMATSSASHVDTGFDGIHRYGPLWSLWHIIDSNFFPLYVESNVSGKFLSCSFKTRKCYPKFALRIPSSVLMWLTGIFS